MNKRVAQSSRAEQPGDAQRPKPECGRLTSLWSHQEHARRDCTGPLQRGKLCGTIVSEDLPNERGEGERDDAAGEASGNEGEHDVSLVGR